MPRGPARACWWRPTTIDRHDRRRPPRAQGDRRRARALLAGGTRTLHEQHFALGPSLGQCCGGAVTLALRAARRRGAGALAADARRSSTCSCTAPAMSAGRSRRCSRRSTSRSTGSTSATRNSRDDEPRLAVADTDPPRLGRQRSRPRSRRAPPGAFFLVLTHEHALDLRIVEAILRRGDFAFCGLIGSKTKRARFEHRLEERGFDAATIARLACPIGIAGIDGRAPEVIAAAVVAAAPGRARPGIADNRCR